MYIHAHLGIPIPCGVINSCTSLIMYVYMYMVYHITDYTRIVLHPSVALAFDESQDAIDLVYTSILNSYSNTRVCVSVCVCMSVCVSVCVCVCMSVCVSV